MEAVGFQRRQDGTEDFLVMDSISPELSQELHKSRIDLECRAAPGQENVGRCDDSSPGQPASSTEPSCRHVLDPCKMPNGGRSINSLLKLLLSAGPNTTPGAASGGSGAGGFSPDALQQMMNSLGGGQGPFEGSGGAGMGAL
eukprot:scaffold331124_cov45-Prasinocladus_malaysianus.AAC.1